MKRLIVATLLALVTTARAQTISIASWNIRIFSTGSRDDTELGLICDRLQQFDMVAIQEVRDEEVVERSLALLEARGHQYEALVSEPVGRGVHERYAFLWRQGAVEALGEGAIWPDPADAFIREPYIASFRAGAFDFTLITMHAIYGDSKEQRRAEALLLDNVYMAVQDGDPGEQDVLLLGDFNLPSEDPGFGEVMSLLTPLFTGSRYTTISESARSLYDNIWFDPAHVAEYTGENGIDAYDVTVFGNDDKAASLAVSDHRPIWARFRTDGPDDDAGSTVASSASWGQVKRPGSGGGQAAPRPVVAPTQASRLVNLNTATLAELETLWGVGPVIAQRIIAGRPYRRVEELVGVKGIGEKKMERIRGEVVVE